MNVKSHAPATQSSATPAIEKGHKPSVGPSSNLAGTVETIEQHLKRLYPTEYVKIITNATRDGGPEHTASLLGYYAKGLYSKPLEVMFLWANAPEGYEFWKALAERSNG